MSFQQRLKDAMSDFWPQTSPALTKKSLTFTFDGQEP